MHTKIPPMLLTVFLLLTGGAPVSSTSQPSAIPTQSQPATATVEVSATPLPTASPTQSDAQVEAALSLVTGEYFFTEGPAPDQNGHVYFSDINAGKIYKWSPAADDASNGSVTVFLDGLNGPNGLAFDERGNLIACEGGNGRLISINPQGQITILADQYNGIRFNEPNDLWIDPQGGIYFTDPAYQSPVVQDGEHVYYLLPDRSQVIRVISDLVRPNGIVGTTDGKTLYVADHGAGQTFVYDIPADLTSLPKNSIGIGTLGTNSVNDRTEYAPPCSKGPGEKIYTYTVYALSAQPQLSVPASQVTRDVLLEAIQNITLASAELNVTYTRK